MNKQTFRIFRIIATLAFIIGAGYGSLFSQQINAIQSKCPSPNQLTSSSVRALADGNILHTPCSVGASVFTGAVDFSGATITGVVTGTGTTNFFPRWTNGAGGILGDTPFSWNTTVYNWNNTALNCTFCMNFTPSATVGTFSVGDANAYVQLSQAAQTVIVNGNTQVELVSTLGLVNLNGSGGFRTTQATVGVGNAQGSFAELANQARIGDTSGVGNSNILSVRDDINTFQFNTGIIYINSDCAGSATLDAAGEFDLTTKTCWTLGTGVKFAFVTGQNTTGILTATGAGIIVSSVGAVDSGTIVNYWIIQK